jgi:hypothetical protein
LYGFVSSNIVDNGPEIYSSFAKVTPVQEEHARTDNQGRLKNTEVFKGLNNC